MGALNLFGVSHPGERRNLLEFNLGAGFLEGSLEGLSLSLGDFLLNGNGSLVNQFLGLFQTKTGALLNGLDDLELSLTSAGEDHIEFGLLSGTGSFGGTSSRSGNCNGCSSGLNTIFFLQDLSEFLDIFHRKVNQLFCANFNICPSRKYLLVCY